MRRQAPDEARDATDSTTARRAPAGTPVYLHRSDWLPILHYLQTGDDKPPPAVRLRDAIELALTDGIDTVLSNTDPHLEER